MSKASEEQLGELHRVIAEGLTDIIRDGAVINVKEDGTEVRGSAPPAYFTAGISMLKLNNITADPSTNEALTDLAAALQKKRGQAKTDMANNHRDLEAATEQLERSLGGLMQ